MTMEKSAIIIVSALCFLSVLGLARANDAEHFSVVGSVYCDTCRVEFVTRISKKLEAARVSLACRDEANSDNITFTGEATTDASGSYHINVSGDHVDEICEISLVNSTDPECNEVDPGKFLKQTGRVSLTRESGVTGQVRQANSLGFLKKEALPDCPQVLKEIGLKPDGSLLDDEE